MPFSASPPRQAAPTPAALKAELCANARVIPIGVSRYDHFPDRPVVSATDNALAWLVQSLRMGISPTGNPLLVEEADAPSALIEKLDDILAVTDLTAAERAGVAGLREVLAHGGDDWQRWDVDKPSFHNILFQLIFVGNHLEYAPTTRTLLTFSGHGAVSRGQLALCASDAEPVSQAPTPAALEAEFEQLIERVVDKRLSVQETEAFEDVMRRSWAQARRRGVLSEFMDVQRITATCINNPWPAFAMLALMQFTLRNLRRIAPQTGRAAPSFKNVIGPVHVMLAFGRHDARCTLVLDACHSGGPGDSLQGSLANHGWLQTGIQSRIISSSEGAQLSAEARVGVHRFSVATWALTHVLSRWSPVEERLNKGKSAYAMNIRNGELVHRANMLLHALSFSQHISLHAPPPKSGAPSAADMPFFGLGRSTRTTTEPSSDAGEIQLSSEVDSLTGWVIQVGPDVKAALVAIGPQAKGWNYNGIQFLPGRLTVLFNNATAAAIANAPSFTMRRYRRTGTQPVPPALQSAVDNFQPSDAMAMPEVNDTFEVQLKADETAANVFSYTKEGGSTTVYLSWKPASGGAPAEMGFWKIGGFPYTPSDFADGPTVMQFTKQASRTFQQGNWKRPIPYGQAYPWPSP